MTDIVVIGGGHNGLVAALQLAGDARVTVLERAARLGGLCAPVPIAPGYVLPGTVHTTSFSRELAQSLGLSLEFGSEPTVHVRDDGQGFRELCPSLDRVDSARSWREFMGRVRGYVRAVLVEPPPPILPTTTSDFWKLGRTGLGLRRLGRADMIELMRVPPMCVADWVNEHFEADPILAEWIASDAVLGGFCGPWSAGTAANLLIAEALREPPILGGPAALASALGSACEARGVTCRLDAEVRKIVVEAGRATAVELADGEVVSADVVLATCDPRTTFLRLVEPVALPTRVEQQFLGVRARGTVARLMLALDGPLEVDDAERAERLYFGGASLDGLERAFDAIKYGTFSDRPVLDVWVPSASIPDLAPCGHHVVSILASFVPHTPRAGWSDDLRVRLQESILARLADAAPTLRDRIVASRLWTPQDIGEELGIDGGCLQHVEHALDQLLFMRPTPSSAHYATPIEGLFLGGAGSHPCGGVTGLPGMLAARTIRRQL